jgi:hypothetical protein
MKLDSSISEGAHSNPGKELHDYLNSKLVSTKKPIEWWGICTFTLPHLFLLCDILQKNVKDFPTLACLACDYLVIQGFSIASE